MHASRFERARVVLAEPKTDLRHRMVEALKKVGFCDIVQTGNLAGVHSALNTGGVDLLIADTIMPEGDVCELISDLRHAKIGDNPFTVVVALISEPTADVVRRAVNAGCDDVLLKPIEPTQVVERINAMVRGRKRFVVTTDYIGPDRRTKTRAEGNPVSLVKVPNPLEMLSTGGMHRHEMRRSIDQAYSHINRHKVERHVYQLDWLSERLTPHIEGSELLPDAFFQSCLFRLRDVAKDLAARIRNTDLNHVTSLCITLERVSAECALDPTSTDKGRWDLLVRLLDSLPRACDPARGGIAPRQEQEAVGAGVSPLLDKQSNDAFGPGGRVLRSV